MAAQLADANPGRTGHRETAKIPYAGGSVAEWHLVHS